MARGAAGLVTVSIALAIVGGCGENAPSGKAMQQAAPPATPSEPDVAPASTPGDSEAAAMVIRALDGAGIGAEKQRSAPLCKAGKLAALQVPGSKAVEAWHIARDLVDETGHWPVILGDDEVLSGVIDGVKVNCEEGKTPRGEVEKSRKIDVAGAFERRRRELGIAESDLKADLPLEDRGTPDEYFTAPTDIVTSKYLDRAWIALVPTRRSWEVPAVLLFGYWNDNPDPAAHVAVHRYWEQRYGSEIVSVQGDVVETYVKRPPTTATPPSTLPASSSSTRRTSSGRGPTTSPSSPRG